MNKKVYKSMLILVIVFLIALYLLKFVMPNKFVMFVENENLVKLGNFIDTHKWLYYAVGVILGFIFDYLYFGAVLGTHKISYKIIIIIAIYNIAYNAVYTFAQIDKNIMIILSTVYMLVVPVLFKAEIKSLVFTYVINSVAQLLTLSIRNIGLLLTNANTISMLLLTIETYIWLGLCFLLFNKNLKKGD